MFSFCSGGAGGKGTWGKMTEAYDNEGHVKDSRDPNYDSQDEEVSVLAINKEQTDCCTGYYAYYTHVVEVVERNILTVFFLVIRMPTLSLPPRLT